MTTIAKHLLAVQVIARVVAARGAFVLTGARRGVSGARGAFVAAGARLRAHGAFVAARRARLRGRGARGAFVAAGARRGAVALAGCAVTAPVLPSITRRGRARRRERLAGPA
ncbi:MAG: hypothetical protein KIT31_25240 [Deltaproteobacteria bacterium]|nr:hypothetical protein [Deltaproteobacteria bacterium]